MSEIVFSPLRSENRSSLISVIARVGDKHRVGVNDILGPARHQHIVKARREAIRAVAEAVGWYPNCGNWSGRYVSSMAIGKLFNRDHSTILYALGRLKKNRQR